MKRGWIWAIVLAVLLGLSFAVWRAVEGRRAQTAALNAPPPAPPAVALADSDVVAAQVAEIARTVPYTGTVKAVRSALVKARTAGELKLLAVREGESVRAGQVVARLDSLEADLRVRQAEQNAQAAYAQLQTAERAVANNQALVDKGFISTNALQTSLNAADAARATHQAAQSAVDLARKGRNDAVLTAPIGGQVSQRFVQPGERLMPEARILEIVDLSALEVEASLDAEAVGLLQVGTRGTLLVDGVADGSTALPALSATVARINPAAQAGSRSVGVYLTTPPHVGLRHGLFARGALELERRSALSLPESAVRRDRPTPYAILLLGSRLVHRPLTLGLHGQGPDGPRVEVLHGLAAGDRVVAGSVGNLPEGLNWKAAPGPAQPAAAAAVTAPPQAPAAAPARPAAPAVAPSAAAAPQG